MNDRSISTGLKYLHGLGAHHETEAVPGALPVGQWRYLHEAEKF